MAEVIITLTDTPTGGVAIQSNFQPAIGAPCSNAQAAALDIIARTKLDWGFKAPLLAEVDIDAVHRNRDRVVASLKDLPPMKERGR